MLDVLINDPAIHWFIAATTVGLLGISMTLIRIFRGGPR